MQNKINIFVVLFFLISYLTGIFFNLSPIPLQDSWDQIYSFLNNKNDFNGWVSLHNEHLIYTARIFYYFNYLLTNGHPYGLVLLNNFFVFFSLFIFLYCFKEMYLLSNNDLLKNSPILFLLILFWSQKSNFIWDVQAQMIYTQIFPLILFLLHFLINDQNKQRLLPVFYLFLFLTLGGMANAVLSALMLVFISFIDLKTINKYYLYPLIIYTVLIICLYFSGLQTSQEFVVDFPQIFLKLLKALVFSSILLGSVVGFLLGKSTLSMFIASLIALMCMVLISKSVLTFNTKKNKDNVFFVSILLFSIYLVCTAILIGFGRVDDEGFKAAYSGRYSTISVYFFISSFLLCFNFFKKYINGKWYFLLLLLFCGYQATSFTNKFTKLKEKECAFIEPFLNNRLLSYEKLHPLENHVRSIFDESLGNEYYIFKQFNNYILDKENVLTSINFNSENVYEIRPDINAEKYSKVYLNFNEEIPSEFSGKSFIKISNNAKDIGYFININDTKKKFTLCGYIDKDNFDILELPSYRFRLYE